jgi:hypothetical protein
VLCKRVPRAKCPRAGRGVEGDPHGADTVAAGRGARRAAAVALSAHCGSSGQIRTGPASAACSRDACRSCRNQYDGSGEPWAGRIESPARIGTLLPDSASSKGASGTIEAPGSAAPLPTRIDSREPIAAISSISRLLPCQHPSMTRTVPAPARRRSSCDPIVLSLSLQPRSGSNDYPRAASSPWRSVPRTPAVRPGSAAAAPAQRLGNPPTLEAERHAECHLWRGSATRPTPRDGTAARQWPWRKTSNLTLGRRRAQSGDRRIIDAEMNDSSDALRLLTRHCGQVTLVSANRSDELL